MKKGILLLLGMFMMVSTVEAKTGENSTDRFRVNYYAYNNAVNFIENGIEFFIFTNGNFDFDIRYNSRFTRIRRNFNGQIRRIGNVNIRYDRFGNVTRIGDVFMRYHRNRLIRVGDLTVNYNRWGDPVFYGNVRDFYYDNGVRFNISFGDVFIYNDPFFYRNDFRRNYRQFREDRNFYYYKARPNARIGKRSTIIKRRKSNAGVRNNNVRKNKNNSYRKARSTTNSRNATTRSRSLNSKPKAAKSIENREKRSVKKNARNNTKRNSRSTSRNDRRRQS
jgi:hypothetical protein